MKKVYLTLLLLYVNVVAFAQQNENILDKMDNAGDAATPFITQAANIFWFWGNLICGILIAYWALQAFRNAKRANQASNEEEFNLMSYLQTKIIGVVVYGVLQGISYVFL